MVVLQQSYFSGKDVMKKCLNAQIMTFNKKSGEGTLQQ